MCGESQSSIKCAGVVGKCCLLLLTLLCAITLQCCQKRATGQSDNSQTFTAALQTITSHLYYSGSIKPLKIIPVTTPVDATIDNMFFYYGLQVTKGEPLFSLSSTQ